MDSLENDSMDDGHLGQVGRFRPDEDFAGNRFRTVATAASALTADFGMGAKARAAGFRPRKPIEISDAADLPKAVLDRGAALLGLVLLMPMLLVVAALIYLRDPGPVLYAHRRIGRHGRVFNCLKFRTMVLDSDAVLARHLAENPAAATEWAATRKLRADPRVTTIGARLRKTSIDELPQLINVLRGEMSLVGPRPIVMEEARHYGEALAAYLAVRPGVTGLWQISGRSDTSYAERVDLDRAYVRGRSMMLDVSILLRTVGVVVKGRGSY